MELIDKPLSLIPSFPCCVEYVCPRMQLILAAVNFYGFVPFSQNVNGVWITRFYRSYKVQDYNGNLHLCRVNRYTRQHYFVNGNPGDLIWSGKDPYPTYGDSQFYIYTHPGPNYVSEEITLADLETDAKALVNGWTFEQMETPMENPQVKAIPVFAYPYFNANGSVVGALTQPNIGGVVHASGIDTWAPMRGGGCYGAGHLRQHFIGVVRARVFGRQRVCVFRTTTHEPNYEEKQQGAVDTVVQTCEEHEPPPGDGANIFDIEPDYLPGVIPSEGLWNYPYRFPRTSYSTAMPYDKNPRCADMLSGIWPN